MFPGKYHDKLVDFPRGERRHLLGEDDQRMLLLWSFGGFCTLGIPKL